MVYSNNIKGSYANKFITGPYKYDYNRHETIIDDNTYSDLDDDCNVPYQYNEFYDLHYFLTSLLDLYISQNLFDWIMKIYPEEVIPEEETSTNGSKTSSYSDTKDSESETNTTYTETSTYTKTSESFSESDSSENDTSTSSDSNSDISGLSDLSINSRNSKNEYVYEGRLINGVETLFKLPTPLDALNDDFFEEFTIKPIDFDENEAIYFKSNI
jgi:hypothetical protein